MYEKILETASWLKARMNRNPKTLGIRYIAEGSLNSDIFHPLLFCPSKGIFWPYFVPRLSLKGQILSLGIL